MKRQYSKPNMSVEMFEANEYIANCVEIHCNKPDKDGVYYIENNGDDGYQALTSDYALDACGANGIFGGTCNNKFVIKESSFNRSDNLYYDSNGTKPGGDLYEAYYFIEKKSYNRSIKHYFFKWTPTGTSAS